MLHETAVNRVLKEIRADAAVVEQRVALAGGAVAGYVAGLVPGSCAVISCISYDDEALGAEMSAMSAASGAGTWLNHSAADVAGF